MHVIDRSFGPGARNRLQEAGAPTSEGALAALETFYYAFNERDLEALVAVWSADPLAQLNNPLGGIVRGADAIAALYGRVFQSPARVSVSFEDIAVHTGERDAIFAGRERGTFVAGGETLPLAIRTTRCFSYERGRWAMVHHHGSIDDADALRAYQRAVARR